jgi:two-component system cell cycle sensor histidine kinase/response regulator CckA
MDDDLFRAIAENIGDGLFVVAHDKTVVYANQAAERIFGESIMGAKVDTLVGEILHPDDGRPFAHDDLPPVRASLGERVRPTDVLLRASRARLCLTSRPLLDQIGRVQGSVTTMRDVTKERRAEEELARTRAFIDSIVENIPDMVFVKDAADLRFERLNRAGELLLGTPRDKLLGKTDHDLFPAEQAEFFQSRDRETLRNGRLVEIAEEPIETTHGRRWLHTKKIPILDERGIPRYLLGISSDITDRRKIEEERMQAHVELERRVEQRTIELRQAEEQLRHAQKLDAVGRLAGGVAHDFNNVLAVILGHVSLLADGSDPHRVREGLESIRAASEHAAALTRQLLAFSRKQVLKPQILLLNGAVERARGMLARLLGEDVTLVTRLSPDVGTVHVDPALIEQVIVNLAVNARDAMPGGGTLTIETANEHLNGAGPPGLAPGAYVSLKVVDTGIGMDSETRARAFEPFFTTKPAGKGTGLGLSMAYGVVAQSGGSIGMESQPGLGTTVTVFLPHARAVATQKQKPLRRNLVPGYGETILVVEDDASLRRVVRAILEQAGYAVLDAGSGQDALALAGRHQGTVDLLLTDVVLPVFSGPELARRLRTSRKNLRVLFMSGYPDERLSDHEYGEFPTEPLGKPFTAEALTERVRSLLDTRIGG